MYIAADCYKYIPSTLRGCSIILLLFSHISFLRGAGAFIQLSAHPRRALTTWNPLQPQLWPDRPCSITRCYPSRISKSHYSSTLEITSSEPSCCSPRCSAAIPPVQHFPALLSWAGGTTQSRTAIFHLPTRQASRKLPAAREVQSLHNWAFQ